MPTTKIDTPTVHGLGIPWLDMATCECGSNPIIAMVVVILMVIELVVGLEMWGKG